MNLFSQKLWRRCAVIAASFLAFFAAGTELALSQSTTINNALHITPHKIVKNENAAATDTEYFKSSYPDEKDLTDFLADTAKSVEAEGIVLLKNDNDALPLAEGAQVSLFGQASVKTNYSAAGGSTAKEGIVYPTFQEALEGVGLKVNQTLLDFYTYATRSNGGKSRGRDYDRTIFQNVDKVRETAWSEIDAAALASVSQYGDAAIVPIARSGGEGGDVSTVGSDTEDGSYLSITPEEEQLLRELTAMKQAGTIKKIIVLLNMSYTMELDFLFRKGIDVDACMWIGNVGMYGIYSVADALVGKVVPSGRLTDTYLRDNFSSPAMQNWMLNPNGLFSQRYSNYAEYFPGSDKATQQFYAAYTEGIYVGYRYYETRYEDAVLKRPNTGEYRYADDVAYPFGYGISYTSFSYGGFGVEETEEGYDVSLTVTNTGTKYAGKETVQIYLQKPYTDYDIQNGVEKASVELVGFAKTDLLAPGESQTLTVSVEREELKSYDANGAGTYILDAGKYFLTAARDAHDAVNNILAAKGYGTEDGMDAAGNADMAKMIRDNPSLDTKTYSVSQETGNPIVNRFDFMDINRYGGRGENRVTYLTRNDWTGTWPRSVVTLSIATPQMVADLTSHKQLPAGGEMPQYGADNGLSLIMLKSTEERPIAYDDPLWESLLDQMSYADQTLLLTSASYSTQPIESIAKPASVEKDGPMGDIESKYGFVLPSEGILAATFNPQLMEQAGKALGEDAAANGHAGLYAPGVNIHRVPFDGRTTEYYSEDAFLSGIACVYEVKGMQSLGVIPTVKHFAFNNEETNRNGISIWMREQEARELYLKPFEFAFRPSMGNAHGVMTSFNRAGCIWTSASPELMQGVLREEWAFDGFSITDMASSNGGAYMTFDDGIINGTDLFLDAVVDPTRLDAYRENAAYAQQMREACHHVLYVFANFSRAMNGISSADRIVAITPWWQSVLIAAISVSAVITATAVVLLAVSVVKEKKA